MEFIANGNPRGEELKHGDDDDDGDDDDADDADDDDV